MITRVEALNYRCLRDIDVRPGQFNILVGPNASGKSTFLDVVLLLSDLTNAGVEKAILKRVRTFRELVWMHEMAEIQIAVEMEVPDAIRRVISSDKRNYSCCRYEVGLGVDHQNGGVHLTGENVFIIDPSAEPPRPEPTVADLFPMETVPRERLVHRSWERTGAGWSNIAYLGADGRASFRSELSGWNIRLRPPPQRTLLSTVPEEERFPVTSWLKRVLGEGATVLALNSSLMQQPCRPDAPLTFKPDGSNLPLVVRSLRQGQPERFERWLAHIRTVFPTLEKVDVAESEVDKFAYLMATYSTGLVTPSWLMSDGTLRLLALTLLAYVPYEGRITLIEEPENGIHPKAIEAVHESLSSVYDGQILCATHSPLFLGLVGPEDLLCFAQAGSGATSIVRGDKHPALRDWRGQVAIETLYAAGVLG
jgi:predicted ATPase